MHFHRCCEPSRESRSSFVSTEIDKRVLPSFPPPRPLSASPSHDSRRCVCKHVHEYLDICPANWALQIFTFCTRAKFGCFFVYCLHFESANKLVTCNDKCKKMKDNVSGTAPLVILTRAMYCIKLEQSYFTYDTVEPILHFRCLEVSYDWVKTKF